MFHLNKARNPLCTCGDTDGQTHIVTCVTDSQVPGTLLDLLNCYMGGIYQLQAVCLDFSLVATAVAHCYLSLLCVGQVENEQDNNIQRSES